MPPTLRNSTKNNTNYHKLYDAISNSKPVKITYNNKTRVVYPLQMGSKTTKKGLSHKNILVLEKIEPTTLWQSIITFIKPNYEWRGFTLNKITKVEVLHQEYISYINVPSTHGKKSTLIDTVEIQANILYHDDEDDAILKI